MIEPRLMTWLYIIIISILTLFGGSVSLAYGVINLAYSNDITRACDVINITGGIFIVLLVFIWSLLSVIFKNYAEKYRSNIGSSDAKLDDNNNNRFAKNGPKLSQNALWAKRKTKELEKQKRKTIQLGVMILLAMCFTLIVELIILGIFWKTKEQLESVFTVQNNCFCSTKAEYQNRYLSILKTTCPQLDGSLPIFCFSVYEPEMIKYRNLVSFTVQCQKLSGAGEADPLCSQYHNFWTWFKIIRVLIPVLSALKLVIIVINYNITSITNQSQEEPQSFNATWLHLDSLVSNIHLDPIKYYRNMCASRKVSPPVGERLGPYGQEREDEMIISIRAANSNGFQNGSCKIKSPGHVEFSKAPTQLFTLQKMVRYSPPDKENNTFSTPLVSKRNNLSPDFNLSHLSGVTNKMNVAPNFTSRLRKCNSLLSVNEGGAAKLSTFQSSALHYEDIPTLTREIQEFTLSASNLHDELTSISDKLELQKETNLAARFPQIEVGSEYEEIILSVPCLNNNNLVLTEADFHQAESRAVSMQDMTDQNNNHVRPTKPPVANKPSTVKTGSLLHTFSKKGDGKKQLASLIPNRIYHSSPRLDCNHNLETQDCSTLTKISRRIDATQYNGTSTSPPNITDTRL